MRDPNRIDKVLAALRAAWTMQPDTRLTQLIYNAANCDQRTWAAVYQTEDDEVVAGLEAMVRRDGGVGVESA